MNSNFVMSEKKVLQTKTFEALCCKPIASPLSFDSYLTEVDRKRSLQSVEAEEADSGISRRF